MNLNKKFIGIEKNEDTFKIAKARINHNMIYMWWNYATKCDNYSFYRLQLYSCRKLELQ
jgi:hypothetical protein